MFSSDHVPAWKKPKPDPHQSPQRPPTLQVPASPGVNSTQKRPTSIHRRPNSSQSDHDAKRARSEESSTSRLVSLSDRFSYRPSKTTNGAPSTVFSRYSALLSGRSPGFSSSPANGMNSSIASSNKPVQTRPAMASHTTSESNGPAAPPAPAMSAKREVSRPSMSIRQKFASSEQRSTSTKSSSEPSSKAFRRLVRKTDMPEETETKKHVEENNYSDESEAEGEFDVEEEVEFENRVLEFLNTSSNEDIQDIAACTDDKAEEIVKHRPYSSLTKVRNVEDPAIIAATKSNVRRRGGPRKTLGEKIVDACSSTLRGYEAVDSLIQSCDKLGKVVAGEIKKWGVNMHSGELDMVDVNTTDTSFFTEKPKLLSPDFTLKDYQQVGINWLSLLYSKGLSCILADEMGLGKTCQVISFLAHLKEINVEGPHLIVVPASTLENWLREFQRFCPALKVEPYYGSQDERAEIREALIDEGANYDVMVTTYNLACGGKYDLGFLKSRRFNVCVYDEGHMLKNSQSERHAKLMRLKAKFRLLLTGTPLQNNLQELISLLSFLMPNLFEERRENLAVIFKHKAKATDSGDQKNPLLSEQRIQKAKTMMTPFILRRRKAQVLQHLPSKSHEVIYCDMTPSQAELYAKEYRESKELQLENAEKRAKGESGKLRNVLMQLRKAAIHCLLFRVQFTNEILKQMAKEIMKEPQYLQANEKYIYEDMEVMNDLELTRLCEQFPATIGHHKISEDSWFNSGKVQKLKELLPEMKRNGDRILIFSQFTQVLDILERVLDTMSIAYLRMDGQTAVEVRQDMLDKFHDEPDITVFLLSTKAGGFGINLACANVVIIFDLSFNPHDDRQAEDRAHRVGQTRDVKVIRMITKDTIEENILTLANTKLALDRSVADGNIDGDEQENANESNVAHMMGLL